MFSASFTRSQGTLAIRYFFDSALITLSIESTSSSISAPYLERAVSLVKMQAWESRILQASFILFILRVEPVETRSTM